MLSTVETGTTDMGKTTRTRGGKPLPEPEVRKKAAAPNKKVAANVDEPPRKVQLVQDHTIEYPQLYLQVYISDPRMESMFAEMFVRAGCMRARDLDEADLVVFTGGPDVHPRHYGMGDLIHEKTSFNEERDTKDIALYADCYMGRIPMLGVCRGAQFLHVMNQGLLFQHVDGHYGDHSIVDVTTGEIIDKVSSTHHQLCVENNRMEILATAGKSRTRWYSDKEFQSGVNPDIEAFFYRETCCLGVQGHPEFRNYPRYTSWVLKQIETKIMHNTLVSVENNNYRVQREAEVI